MRRVSVLNIILFMVIMCVFDATVRNIANLNFEFYLSFTIVAAVELPADLFNIFGVDWIGRRWTAALALLLCGLTMLVCAFTKGRLTRIFERLIWIYFSLQRSKHSRSWLFSREDFSPQWE